MSTENKLWRLVSDLIRREAVARGIIAEAAPAEDEELTELRRRMAAMQADLDALARKRASGAGQGSDGKVRR